MAIASIIVVCLCVTTGLQPAFGDQYVLGGLPFIVTKFPLFWWLTKDDGKNVKYATTVLSANLFCWTTTMGAVFSLRTRIGVGSALGSAACAHFSGASMVLFTLQSHFYVPPRLRWRHIAGDARTDVGRRP